MSKPLPLPPAPSFDPTTSALPPLPTPKTRKSSTPGHSAVNGPLPPVSLPVKLTTRSLSRPSIRTLIPGTPKTPHTSSTPCIPTLKSTTTALSKETNHDQRSVKRRISIASFPQPPKGGTRIGTLPGRPSLHGSSRGSPVSPPAETFRRTSGDSTNQSISAAIQHHKKLKASPDATSQSYAFSGAPSLLNGTGDDQCISVDLGKRGSDGLLSLPSPLDSRSSSALGSSSTSATTFEDVENTPRNDKGDIGKAVSGGNDRPTAEQDQGNVVVSVRVRPDIKGKDEASFEDEWLIDGRRSLMTFKGRDGKRGNFFYDNVFTARDKNDRVYDAAAKRLVRRVMEGYHGTVFAYGMTGTGKTFSMQGTKDSLGVTPSAIADIFSYIREVPEREFLLRVSYLEIYNEKIHDLLAPSANGGVKAGALAEKIELHEDSNRGVYASPLREETVQSPNQLLRVIARGDMARKTSSTQFNARSSRSHAVVQIIVESRERVKQHNLPEENKRSPIAPGGVRVSTLSLIDLAGSERAALSKDRQAEGSHINKSLLTLGTVIGGLSGATDKAGNRIEKDVKHLPYRDSKLTRLLQSALSGNSLVSILCTIQIGSVGSTATANTHAQETLNTLKFASRAKNKIISHAKKSEEVLVNGPDNGNGSLLEYLRMENLELQKQVSQNAATRKHEGASLENQLARTALRDREERLKRLIITSQSAGANSKDTLSPLIGTLTKPTTPRNSMGKAAGTRSLRSSASHSTILRRNISGTSTTTISNQIANNLSTTKSSTSQNNLSANFRGLSVSDFVSSLPNINHDQAEDDVLGEFADGTASPHAQICALRADLEEKTRYIEHLEERHLELRRQSNLGSPAGFSAIHDSQEEGILALAEREDEINSLMTLSDFQDAWIGALRGILDARDAKVARYRNEVKGIYSKVEDLRASAVLKDAEVDTLRNFLAVKDHTMNALREEIMGKNAVVQEKDTKIAELSREVHDAKMLVTVMKSKAEQEKAKLLANRPWLTSNAGNMISKSPAPAPSPLPARDISYADVKTGWTKETPGHRRYRSGLDSGASTPRGAGSLSPVSSPQLKGMREAAKDEGPRRSMDELKELMDAMIAESAESSSCDEE